MSGRKPSHSNDESNSRESSSSSTSFQLSQFPGSSGFFVADIESHVTRVNDLRERQLLFEQSSQQLAAFIANPETVAATSVASVDALRREHDILLSKPENYTNATQSNMARVSILYIGNHQDSQNNSSSSGGGKSSQTRNNFYIHLLQLKNLPADYKTQQFAESLKILKYFCRPGSPGRQACFHKIFDIYAVSQEQQVLVIEESFLLENTIQHRMWGNAWMGQYQAPIVKTWATQLADAIEKLNQAGVAHRFIRSENVILSSRNDKNAIPRLASFDFACLFWDTEAHAAKPVRPRGLPLELPGHLLNHLPPESFFDGYDASNLDTWSLGVLICQLLTGNAPFETPDLANDKSPEHETMWKRSNERRMLPEEIRSLLDDVFKEADGRITAHDMVKDFRLKCKDTREYVKKKPPAYYRIDLAKNINVDRPGATVPPKAAPLVIASSTFSEHSSTIFQMDGYHKMKKLTEEDVTEYRIHRELSFQGDLEPNSIINDQYLKAIKAQETPCLAKIIQKRRIPIGHRNLLLNESSKIMRYFSATESLNVRVHRVLDIFLCEESTHGEKLIIFYENLAQHRSLYQLVKEVPEDFHFPPLADGNAMLTLANIQVWIREVTQLAECIAHHGLAHRYIRPEYVFVNEADYERIKLTHFDMACFVWNPNRSLWVPRTQGLQDRQEQQWDHLPPDCFDPLYDARQVDSWSIGVVLTFCLTGAKPFTPPMTMDQASEQWANFKATHVSNRALNLFTEILNLIFAPTETRLGPKSLLAKLENLRLAQSEGNGGSARKNGTGKGIKK